jgi:HNH endonuclease
MKILVSKEDQYLLKEYKWFIKSNGYVTAKIGGKFKLLHRVIMNAKEGQEVDHINRNKLDNRRGNLRFADRHSQMRNAKHKAGVTGAIGVGKHLDHFVVRIRLGKGKRKNLGCFNTIEDAKNAYSAALSYEPMD